MHARGEGGGPKKAEKLRAYYINGPFDKHTDEQTEGTKGRHEKWTFKLQHSLKTLCCGL